MMGPQAYMVHANEELFEKELTPLVEDVLKSVCVSVCLSVCGMFVQV